MSCQVLVGTADGRPRGNRWTKASNGFSYENDFPFALPPVDCTTTISITLQMLFTFHSSLSLQRPAHYLEFDS